MYARLQCDAVNAFKIPPSHLDLYVFMEQASNMPGEELGGAASLAAMGIAGTASYWARQGGYQSKLIARLTRVR
jgi:hypothetical protein